MSPATAGRPSRASVGRELERDVLSGCLAACRALGIDAERRNVGQVGIGGRTVRFGRTGAADITGTIPRGPNQGKRLEAAGGISFWIDDIADCLRVLRRVLDGAWVELDEAGSQWVVWDEPRPPPGPQLQPPGTTQGAGPADPAGRFSCARGL